MFYNCVFLSYQIPLCISFSILTEIFIQAIFGSLQYLFSSFQIQVEAVAAVEVVAAVAAGTLEVEAVASVEAVEAVAAGTLEVEAVAAGTLEVEAVAAVAAVAEGTPLNKNACVLTIIKQNLND